MSGIKILATVWVVAILMCLVSIGSFLLGGEHVRSQIREATRQVAEQGPTNSFSRCLTELWEQSGELDPQWKGKRRWALVDENGQPVKE